MIKAILEHPIILVIATLIICLLGLVSVFRVPVQMIPDMEPRIVTVETRWPGATPQDMEQEILVEQEEYLSDISGLERMKSSANFGSATIELTFPFGVDVNEALILVNNALSQVPDYPENVDQPRVVADSISDNAFMFFGVRAINEDYQGPKIAHLKDWVDDNVASRIGRVAGVSGVSARSGVSRQINIYIDPAKLAARGLTVIDVRNVLRQRNRDISGGDLNFGKRRYLLRTMGRFSDLDSLNQLILSQTNGAYVRLSDVGYAEMGYEEARMLSYVDGEFQVMISIGKLAGANVISIKQGVLKVVDELNNGILKDKGLYLDLVSEDARYVERSVATVLKNLVFGGLLAAGVLMLFLRSGNATLIGCIGLPMCVLAAFLGLSFTGRSINVISLAGVAFAIGMTLDNSIVALENIAQHLAKGKSRAEAAYAGIKEVWPAILASTLTTIMVFLPIIFLKMEAGQLYSDIAIAISSSILMSMLIAISLIPIACRRLLNINYQQGRKEQAFSNAILQLVRWLLASVQRRVSVLILTLAAVVMVFKFAVPAAEYLPEGEESKVFTYVAAPAGYNLETMNRVRAEMGHIFSDQVGAERGGFERGETPVPPLEMNMVIMRPGVTAFLSEPVESADTPALIKAATEAFATVPGMRTFSSRGSIFSDNNGGTRSINLELSGNDLEQLYRVSLNVLQQADELFEGGQVNATPSPSALTMSEPMLELYPDWERASELGMSQDELGYTIAAYSDGAFVDEYFMDDDKLDIYLFSLGNNYQHPQDLENIVLFSADGQQFPLSSVATLKETVSASGISRIDGRRTVTIAIVPPRHIPLESAVATVKNKWVPELKLNGVIPPAIMTDISGASSSLAEARSAMSGHFLLAVLIAYLLLVAVFSHWGYPLIIMTIVPVGIGGGILGLALFNGIAGHLDILGKAPVHQPFDVISMLGFLVLIGTVVNNPILIVERTVTNIKQFGMSTIQGIEEAVKTRLRPILMSTITTICGLAPLVCLPGEGAELYRGLGAIVLFGLLFSSFIAVTVLPTLLAVIFDSKMTNKYR